MAIAEFSLSIEYSSSYKVECSSELDLDNIIEKTVDDFLNDISFLDVKVTIIHEPDFTEDPEEKPYFSTDPNQLVLL